MKHLPAEAVVLFEDETILRLFPVLRRAWSLRGEQAEVPITGRNDKRVLFGTINLRTGHRIVLRQPNMRQASFHAFLRVLRRARSRSPDLAAVGSSRRSYGTAESSFSRGAQHRARVVTQAMFRTQRNGSSLA